MKSPGTGITISEAQLVALAHGPIPQPTSDTREFWDATSRHELVMPYCNACNRYFFYPRVTCRHCHSEDIAWKPVSGKGTIVSYVINHLPFAEFETREPQVIAVIGLEEGVSLLSQIVTDTPIPEEITLGMPVTVAFIPRGEITLPFFVAVKSEGANENA